MALRHFPEGISVGGQAIAPLAFIDEYGNAKLVSVPGAQTSNAKSPGFTFNAAGITSGSGDYIAMFQRAGTSKLGIDREGIIAWQTGSTCQLSIAPSGTLAVSSSGGTSYLTIDDSTGVISALNGTSPQAIRLYKTFTDASNYERLAFGGGAGAAFAIQPEAAGTGTLRALVLCQASGTLGFFGTTGAGQQTSGANVTNNVTVGGSNDTIADFADLTTYSNSAATIRNNIYQLARKVKQINDGLRSLGMFT